MVLFVGVAGINVRDPRWSDIHVFSGALKLYLRDLPEPIFTYQMYSDFIKAGSMYMYMYTV